MRKNGYIEALKDACGRFVPALRANMPYSLYRGTVEGAMEEAFVEAELLTDADTRGHENPLVCVRMGIPVHWALMEAGMDVGSNGYPSGEQVLKMSGPLDVEAVRAWFDREDNVRYVNASAKAAREEAGKSGR